MYKPKSNCCQAEVEVVSEDEGTSYYKCSKCGKPCDMDEGKMDANKLN